MSFASASCQGLHAVMFAGLAKYRRKVFIERLGWELRCAGGQDAKRLERHDAIDVETRSETGEVNGSARLLPAARPYRLGSVCPELFDGPRLSTTQVWELSRFAAVDFSAATPLAANANKASMPVAGALLRKAVACAGERGARRLVTVSTLGIERLFREARLPIRRAGPAVVISGKPAFVCWVDI